MEEYDEQRGRESHAMRRKEESLIPGYRGISRDIENVTIGIPKESISRLDT